MQNFILDTNVLIHDPSAYRQFKENEGLAAHMLLTEGVRSELAEKAANLL